MIKTKTWVILLILLLAGSTAAAFFLYTRKPEQNTVQILQDGKCVKRIDLSQVEEPYSFTIEDGHGGSNTILVEPGRICISEADCPDQVCVRRGWLSNSVEPIVCLPHHLVISMEGETELDTMAQ